MTCYVCASPACIDECLPEIKERQQEPVAWKDKTYGNLHHQNFGNSIPLYTAPPSKQWVGLTDDEMNYLWGITPPEYQDRFALARAVETKLKEKNT